MRGFFFLLQAVLSPKWLVFILVMLAGPAWATHSGFLEYRQLSVAQLNEARHSVTGVERARLLLILAQKQIATAFADSRTALDEARQLLTNEAHDESVLADALESQLELRRGNIAASDAARVRMEAHADVVSDPVVLALVSWTRSFIALREGRPTESIVEARTLEHLARSVGDIDLVAIAHNAQGVALMESGLPDSALEQYELAWQAASAHSERDFIRVLRFNIGVGQLEAGHYEKALTIFLETLPWIRESANVSRELIARTMIGRAFLGLDDEVSAIEYLADAVANSRDNADPDSVLGAMAVLGSSYIRAGRLPEARDTLSKGLGMAESHGNLIRARQLRMRYAEALIESDDAAAATAVLNKQADELAATSPTRDLQATLQTLARASEKTGNFERAYNLQLRAAEIGHALQTSLFDKRISILQATLDLDVMSQELAIAQEQMATMNMRGERNAAIVWGVLAAALLTILLALAGYFWWWQRRRARRAIGHEHELEDLLDQRLHELEDAAGERQKLEKSLREHEHIRLIGQLTSGVAHDFNNLMNVVMLCADALKASQPGLTNEQKRCVEDIVTTAESGAEITSALLAYAREQPLDPGVIGLGRFMSESEAIFRHTLGEGIALELDVQPCDVVADRSQLMTAIINLLLNAREAIASDGKVTIAVRPDEGKSQAGIIVRDNGHGMTRQECARAIEPFFTTKQAGEGSGLGLSIVYGFAGQSGGEFRLRSSPGAGTEAILSLPMADKRDRPAGDSKLESSSLPAGTRVLVVEDQPAVRKAICQSLGLLGCVTDEAASGDEARTMLDEGWSGDVVISDIVMPGHITGDLLAAYIETHRPELPVLLVSGYNDAQTDKLPFLRKPFSIQQLDAAVSSILSPPALTT